MNLCFQLFFLTFNQPIQEKTQQDEAAYVTNYRNKKMKRFIYFVIFISSLINISCSNKNEEIITNFIFIQGNGISFDSLKKPQLQILKYLDYSVNNKIRIAKGKREPIYSEDNRLNLMPTFGLIDFYEINNFDSLESLINYYFIGKIYDSTYKSSRTENQNYNYFILSTSKGNKKEILFYNNTLPNSLDSLDKFINRLFVTQNLIKTKRFTINKLVKDLQKKLFDKFPPPPPPQLEELKEAKYIDTL